MFSHSTIFVDLKLCLVCKQYLVKDPLALKPKFHKLLQLNHQELVVAVQKEMLENPALEEIPGGAGALWLLAVMLLPLRRRRHAA